MENFGIQDDEDGGAEGNPSREKESATPDVEDSSTKKKKKKKGGDAA
jgi:hypothetical protein